jgi:hypothetical protein
MLHLTFRRVRDEAALRAWMAELGQRADEVRATFRQEGVRHEQAFLLPSPDGLVLVYAHEVEDPEAASAAYAQSSLPIDAEHRQRMAAALAEAVEPELLYDVRL